MNVRCLLLERIIRPWKIYGIITTIVIRLYLSRSCQKFEIHFSKCRWMIPFVVNSLALNELTFYRIISTTKSFPLEYIINCVCELRRLTKDCQSCYIAAIFSDILIHNATPQTFEYGGGRETPNHSYPYSYFVECYYTLIC